MTFKRGVMYKHTPLSMITSYKKCHSLNLEQDIIKDGLIWISKIFCEFHNHQLIETMYLSEEESDLLI